MKLNPIINATKERVAPSTKDHVLVVLPTVAGSDEFVSVSTYEDLVDTFGIHYTLPKISPEVDQDDEEYSTLLLNSLKYILDRGTPILCCSVKQSVNAAIRFYYLPENSQPWYVCSIAHKSLPQGLRDLPQNLRNFFQSEGVIGKDTLGTLCHILPLNRYKDDEGLWRWIEDPEDTTNARFITLPIQDMSDPDTPLVPYCIMLENNGLELGTANDDLYSGMSPIQVSDIYGNKTSLVMRCHGSDSEIYDEVTRINQIFARLDYDNDITITRWKCVFDKERNQILFISNQYIHASGSYSIYGGYDFEPDSNISGALLDEYTKDHAVFDIVSNLSGELGNEFRVKFDKTQKGNFMSIYQLANQLEFINVYDADSKLEQMTDSEFITFIQYDNSDYPDIMNIFNDSYFKDKKFLLSGGSNIDEFTYSEIGEKLNDYTEIEDDVPVDFIFDCMLPHLDFHEKALEAITGFSNKFVHLITNGDLYSGNDGLNPYIKLHRQVFYNNVPVPLPEGISVSLGAVIINKLHNYDYLPNIRAILSKDYLDKIKVTQGTDVITPEIDHEIVYLNELKIADLDLETSIDRYLSSFISNELKMLFVDNYVGKVYDNKSEAIDDAIKILENMTVANNLILSYSINELSRYESTIFLSLRVYREEISGGVRNLYININL